MFCIRLDQTEDDMHASRYLSQALTPVFPYDVHSSRSQTT